MALSRHWFGLIEPLRAAVEAGGSAWKRCRSRVLDLSVQLCENHRPDGVCESCETRDGVWQDCEVTTFRGKTRSQPKRVCAECSPSVLLAIDAQNEVLFSLSLLQSRKIILDRVSACHEETSRHFVRVSACHEETL